MSVISFTIHWPILAFPIKMKQKLLKFRIQPYTSN